VVLTVVLAAVEAVVVVVLRPVLLVALETRPTNHPLVVMAHLLLHTKDLMGVMETLALLLVAVVLVQLVLMEQLLLALREALVALDRLQLLQVLL
jgi:hypothetical protein